MGATPAHSETVTSSAPSAAKPVPRPAPERTRLLLMIRSLGHGGAERQLIELAKALDPTLFEIHVVTLYDGGGLLPEIERVEGIRVSSLHKKTRWDFLTVTVRLARLVRATRPHILHGYMGPANELCLLMAAIYGGHTVWGLRLSDRDLSRYDWGSSFALRLGAWLSRWPSLIIANSHAGLRDHQAHGYRTDRMVVVHNGIDVTRFHRSPEARQAKRAQLQIPADDFLIGIVARLDPQKDHATFLRAAALVAREIPAARFLCIGTGGEKYAAELRALAAELELADRVQWVAPSRDVVGNYNALDLATLTSANGEGFANVVGEAMACEVPVVVTDAGDCAQIVGNPAQVVPIRNPAALADAWLRIARMPSADRAALGTRQRARISENFTTAHLAENTIAAFETIP